MARRKTLDEFKLDLKRVWGDQYKIAPNSSYVNSTTKMTFICPIHGEFEQIPTSLLEGHGCQKCTKKHKYTTKEFIDLCCKKHGGKYDYSKVNYINTSTPVTIICPKHGEFNQTPNAHLINGHICPKCANEAIGQKKRMSIWEFSNRAKLVHGDKYDYSKVEYKSIDEPVTIICPIHGEFNQTPYNHLRGCECPLCSNETKKRKLSLTKEDFISKARNIFGDKYGYDKIHYVNLRTKINITCPKHGEFWQIPDNHLQGHGCPMCGNQISKAENEIFELVQTFCSDVIHNERGMIKPYELDIYVPSKRIGIEYNGLRWHSEEFNKDKNYHLKKLELCNSKGIKLIQVFEDEWVENKELVKDKILHLLGVYNDKPKIYARKCDVKEIDKILARDFLTINHIQGFVPSSIYLGCFYHEELVGVMTFIKEKMNGYWNLSRFASSNDYICEGVGGKLFKYFIRHYGPKEVKSFADRRWTLNSDNNLYVKLGFQLESTLKPDYRYVFREEYGLKRIHKFNFRIHMLNKKYGLPLTMTETQMTNMLGAYKIWDCGLFKYVWKNQ